MHTTWDSLGQSSRHSMLRCRLPSPIFTWASAKSRPLKRIVNANWMSKQLSGRKYVPLEFWSCAVSSQNSVRRSCRKLLLCEISHLKSPFKGSKSKREKGKELYLPNRRTSLLLPVPTSKWSWSLRPFSAHSNPRVPNLTYPSKCASKDRMWWGRQALTANSSLILRTNYTRIGT